MFKNVATVVISYNIFFEFLGRNRTITLTPKIVIKRQVMRILEHMSTTIIINPLTTMIPRNFQSVLEYNVYQVSTD